MRTYEKEDRLVVDNKLANITCNKCGISSSYTLNNKKMCDIEAFQELSTSFGYGSRYDMERWSFDLCEDCLTELIKTFKHVPDGFGQDSYYAAYPQVMFDKWKETGEVDLEAGMTEDEIEARGGSIYVSYEEDKNNEN